MTKLGNGAIALFCTLMLFGLSGCVSTKSVPIDQSTASNLRDKTLALSASNKPDFSAVTAGKATFGFMGALAMIDAGNRIVEEYDIADPAIFLAEEMSKVIKDRNLVMVKLPVHATNENDVEELAESHAESDFLLDVRTVNWGYSYFPMDWNNYAVNYSAKVRLIETSSAEVRAEAFCGYVDERHDDSPSHDDLLENRAERLKQELHVAATECLAILRSKLVEQEAHQ